MDSCCQDIKVKLKVKELHSEDFFDFKYLAETVPNFVYDIQGQKIKRFKTKIITLEDDNSNIVNFLYSDLTSLTLNFVSDITVPGRTNHRRAMSFQLFSHCIVIKTCSNCPLRSTKL